MLSPDYQQFDMADGKVRLHGERMTEKARALEGILPPLLGKSVLDVGCDHGYWSFKAAEEGAIVTGIDRGREVRGSGFVDLAVRCQEVAEANSLHASFLRYEIGRQWPDIPKHDVVLCMSMYHHVLNLCGDHDTIWYWLWRCTGEVLIWENPVSVDDRVVQMNVALDLQRGYAEIAIRHAARQYFDTEVVRPALHEPHRQVWRLVPKTREPVVHSGEMRAGAGGASKAFKHADGRRAKAIADILGFMPYPGSLNVLLETPFDWERNYFRAQLPDVADRAKGLESAWNDRWVRFYPVMVGGYPAFAMRFEGERYPPNFVELIAPVRLRDRIRERVEIVQ